jgi:hypothetical protein
MQQWSQIQVLSERGMSDATITGIWPRIAPSLADVLNWAR